MDKYATSHYKDANVNKNIHQESRLEIFPKLGIQFRKSSESDYSIVKPTCDNERQLLLFHSLLFYFVSKWRSSLSKITSHFLPSFPRRRQERRWPTAH